VNTIVSPAVGVHVTEAVKAPVVMTLPSNAVKPSPSRLGGSACAAAGLAPKNADRARTNVKSKNRIGRSMGLLFLDREGGEAS
jgi:hypothetical protein